MAIFNTSNVIDNSIFLKAKLEKNMVGSNYYIENLQDKRNEDWEYRYNVVDIEEELHKQCEYSCLPPSYSPIDAVITSVKSETGQDLSTDWAHIAFRNLKHPIDIGSRYRFSLNFPDMREMTEEEKHYNTCVWICVNKSPIKAGNSCIIRRCNTSLVFVGSPTKDRDYITEIHEEPCALDNDLKYMQVYYNMTLPIPQAEWYATVQLNYYTNQIKLNDRYIFNVADRDDRENNSVYKVKAIIKGTSNRTFIKDEKTALEETPILIMALDKDLVAPDDDFTNRIAEAATIYKTLDIKEPYKYYIDVEEPSDDKIFLGDNQIYNFNIKRNDSILDNAEFSFELKLNGIIEENWDKYFNYEIIDINSIKINNTKTCSRGKLILKVTWINPPPGVEAITESYEITLGGFY